MMRVSVVIVSKNRKNELDKTLSTIKNYIDNNECEVLVFLDGCSDNSISLKSKYSWVRWEEVDKSVGASKARNILIKKTKGEIIIGFDDDAHPLQPDFIKIVDRIFRSNNKIGVIAFKEIKGIFKSDEEVMRLIGKETRFLCREFIGCGYAIKRTVYFETNGFPEWIDIYGEEPCLSLEVMNKDYDILFTNELAVNHRVNIKNRLDQGYNYFRYRKQLKNATFYYLVYYRWPFKSILKLYSHNFYKYALRDFNYLFYFFQTILICFIKFPSIKKYRNPISKEIIDKKNLLKSPV